jgi:hypothetical protein
MTDTLTRTLLERFLEDLKMRQAEFRNDHTIRTALEMAIRETEQQLREHEND